MKDPAGVGWHTIQTNIALGSGGLFGLGLGASRQKFFWLPAAHTDAIFAVIGEELGLFGTTVVLGLFLIIGQRGLKIMMAAPDAFGRLMAGGITVWILLQALLNIAVVTALIPFTGIPLPFLSSGGSSMTVSLIAMGILLNISRQAAAYNPDRRRRRGA
jgi:cell division protein FtsW